MVRAKFKVDRIESSIQVYADRVVKDDSVEYAERKIELRTVVLTPVYKTGNEEDENSKFWRYTPSGEIRLGSINPEAWAQFELLGEYYVDFTPAKDSVPPKD